MERAHCAATPLHCSARHVVLTRTAQRPRVGRSVVAASGKLERIGALCLGIEGSRRGGSVLLQNFSNLS